MKLVISSKGLCRILLWMQIMLTSVGVSLLGYYAFVLIDAWRFQQSQQRLERAIAEPVPSRAERLPIGAVIGRIEIARLGVSVIVVAGVTDSMLRRAAGHIPGTALPGQPGNIGISAHRDTYFRPLRNIRADDRITLTTPAGVFGYRVVWTKVVSPHEVWVLKPAAAEVLTLVTCYPFYFVGPAPERLVVRAERFT